MDYLKIHNKLIQYCKDLSPLERLKKRNPSDVRIKGTSLYTEIHHIIPRSLGGSDELLNLIELLPEEHIFIHMLRYKLYKEREDILAVRFMLNGFSCNSAKGVSNILTKKLRMGYAWIRHQSAELRKGKGWQTEDGRRRISESRKGYIVVKDFETGKKIGCVSNKHEHVLSGKWVHHSKGKKLSQGEIEGLKIRNKGQKNPNASGLTEEYFIDIGVKLAKEFGRILSWPETLALSQKRGFKWIKSLKSRFEGRALRGYYEEVVNKTGLKYDPWQGRRKK